MPKANRAIQSTKGLLAAMCALVPAAHAQDSVSAVGGLPGDALSPYLASDQCARFVVDLVAIESSAGRTFAIAPILKLPRSEPGAFFNNLPLSSAVSARYAPASFDGSTYDLWTQPGEGISTADNTAPAAGVTPSGPSLQFALAAADFAPIGIGEASHVTGAVVQVDPEDASRLFVHRQTAAVSGLAANASTSSLSLGSVTETGVLALRADGHLAREPDSLLSSELWLVDLETRGCSIINSISAMGAADASASSAVPLATSSIVSPPSLLTTTASDIKVFAPTFSGELIFGDAASTTPTAAHLSATTPFATTDHRGTTSFSPVDWFVGSAGTAAILSFQEPAAPADNAAIGLSFWGVDGATGGVLPGTPTTLLLPAADAFGSGASIVDNEDGFEIGNNAQPGSDWRFSAIQSQVAFRGGNGQVAISTDASDRLLLAAQVGLTNSASGGPNPSVNAIAVARVDPLQIGTPAWTLAAWVDASSPTGGKAIFDEQGAVIGHLEELALQTAGDPFGPSLSSPAIDAGGNVWFVGSARFFDAGAPGGSRSSLALFRSVYDQATFSYRLERIIESGDVVRGANSNTDYQIQSLELADRNSIASSALTAGSIIHQPWLGQALPTDTSTAASLGGLVVAASIIYDTNNDSLFEASSPDEQYNVVLFVGAGEEGGTCLGDFADDFGTLGSDGQVSFGDFLALLTVLGPCPGGQPGCFGDIADDFGSFGGDGQVSFGDFLALLTLLGPCP